MLDAIKGLIEGGKLQKQSDELQQLIAAAREQQEALTAVLGAIAAQGPELDKLNELLHNVDRKADDSTARVDAVSSRLQKLEARTTALAGIDGRVQALIDAANQAQQTAARLTGPGGELQSHRLHVQRLSALTVETQASAAALKKEHDEFEQCLGDLARSRTDMAAAIDDAARLRGEVDRARATVTNLSEACAALRDVSGNARRDSEHAAATVHDLEQRLEYLTQMGPASAAIEEKLTFLNSLSEYVFQKTQALDGQKQTVDRATADATRLNDMVWNMNAQISKLREELVEAERGRETIGKIEQLVDETNQKLEYASKIRTEFAADATRFERDGHALLETLRGSLDSLAMEKSQFDAFDFRLRTLQTSLEGAEVRMSTLLAKERDVSELRQHLDALDGQYQSMAARANEMASRQARLETLADRLTQVDDLARQTSLRYDSLIESRGDLEALRREVHELQKSRNEAAQLRDRLAADRAALDAFAERVNALRERTPGLELEIDALLGKFSQVDVATKQAKQLAEMAVDLDARLTRLTGRAQFVDALDARINALHVVSVDVDRRLSDQLARRAELESIRTALDGLAGRMRDAEQSAETIQALQAKVSPIEEQVRTLAEEVQKSATSVEEVQRDEQALAERRFRLDLLFEHTRALADETADRTRQMQALSSALDQSVSAKNEILAALSAVEQRQRETLAQSAATEDQVRRLDAMLRSVDERHAQLALAERSLTAIESRFAGLTVKSRDLDAAMQRLAEREAIVQATKAEVDLVHQAGMKSRADLQYVHEHREEVAAVRYRIEALLATATDAEDKIASIESRHALIESVQTKANFVANLLEDLRVTLDTVGERKAMVEHMAVKLARLEFVLQEAQNTIRALQHERELAQRIEQQITQLRGRTGPGEGTPVVSA